MAIPQDQLRSKFTERVVQVFRETPQPTGFLRSFFPDQVSLTKYISLEVQRGTEKVSADVARNGSDGYYNESTEATERIIEPPMYWEIVNATNHRLYETALGQQSPTAFAQLAREIALDVQNARNKVERAYELQAKQVLEDGILNFNFGQIDYNRKADSKVDLSSNPWTNSSTDPIEDLEQGGDFIRKEGKSQTGVFNVICGSEAINALRNNDKYQAIADNRGFQLTELAPQQQNAVGAVPQGFIQSSSYNFRLWTYPQFYEDSSGTMQPYIPNKKVIMLPDAPNFMMHFGAVPQLMTDNGGIPQQGAYHTFEYTDIRNSRHEIHQKSAGVAVPVAVDQMWTAKVVS